MRRVSLLVIAAALLCSATSSAQVGRIRSAVTNAARPQEQQPGKPAQMEVIPITSQVVTNYEKAVAARNREIQRLARENSPTGRYFAATLRRDSLELRKAEYRAQRGPDFEREQQLQARLAQGDTTVIQAIVHVRDFLNTKVEVPEMDWSTQAAANAHMDSVMMQAAGFSAGEWAYVADKVPPLAGWVANDGVPADSVAERLAQTFSITRAEVRAIAARRVEIARANGWFYRTDEEIAKANQPAATTAQEDPTRDYNACMADGLKPLHEEAERRKAEFEAAQQSGDMSKLMEFATRVTAAQQAAALKCAPLQNQ